MMTKDFQSVAKHASDHLDLSINDLGREYFYPSLPLCIIDAVFSIGVNYLSTKNTVSRYCLFFDLPNFSSTREIFEKSEMSLPIADSFPTECEQETITAFLEKFSNRSPSQFAVEVFQNQQRTSTHNGILKAEAVRDFALALNKNGINNFQDLAEHSDFEKIENDLLSIKGQSSGISIKYFWMLSGNKNQIKPDRMVCRFVEDAIGRSVSTKEAESIIIGAFEILSSQFNKLNLRLLDYKIWCFQRRIKGG